MSCTNMLGTIPNQDEHESFRGVEHEITFFQKMRLEFFINDESLEPVIEVISKGGHGTGGTGKIFVSELQDCVSTTSSRSTVIDQRADLVNHDVMDWS